ncbi:alpha/beta hydrolase fold domain-containing protein [Streptomyces sp. 150FB]|uniref:alpha/beta hydrolase n=1 Tax=Streptomyces sp. 150FB TaxID=1576605 RepID=UPI000699042A|nr:alpha/beta hydrolase fold domain-containing protein [Streptomyces sp. 150FB]
MRYPDIGTPAGLAEIRATDYSAQRPRTQPVEDRIIPGPAGDLRLHIIRPDGPLKAVMLSVHGGGWCIGAPEDDDGINDHYARHLGIVTVAVGYRLAPEHPYPAAVEDCVAAARWLGQYAEREFGTGRLLLHGASAGSHLATQTLLHLRDNDPGIHARIAAASLVYGIYDISGTPSQRYATPHTLVLPSQWLQAFTAHTFPGRTENALRHPSISPLYADLKGLPPALFTVGDLDPLLDDSLFLAARWRAAGNRADTEVWQHAPHGFNNLAPKTGAAVLDRITAWLSDQLAAD